MKATLFQLYDRAKHVFTEALRVLQFREISLNAARMQDHDEMFHNKNKWLEDLGGLMNESQESCAYQFECSCPELDGLTRLAREAGAFGSRLTGLCALFPTPGAH